MRILVTGSRDWTDRVLISRAVLREINSTCPMIHDKGRPLYRDLSDVVIVHGACPRGADALVELWARNHASGPIKTEPHPADWKRLGKVAGYARNADMVELGADVCLGFIKPCTKEDCDRIEPHGSHGASHCSDLAELAGIRTRRISP